MLKLIPESTFYKYSNKQIAPVEQFIKTIPQYYYWFVPTVFILEILVKKEWIKEDFKTIQEAKPKDYDNFNKLLSKTQKIQQLTKEESEELRRLFWNIQFASTAIMPGLWYQWYMWDWKSVIMPRFNSNNTFQLAM